MDTPPLCHRCLTPLTPGQGNFYLITIEAKADPTLTITPEDLAQNHAEQIHQLTDDLAHYSEQELLDMVYRKLSFPLCGPCYKTWIENPVG